MLATATDLMELGIRPILLEKYCGASNGIAYHNAGIISMESLIGKHNIYREMISSASELDSIYEKAVELTRCHYEPIVDIEYRIVD